jgi:hypothetical protein
MEPKEKYQGGLWVKIRRLPYLVAMGMEGAAKSGWAGSAQERHAMAESLVKGVQQYPDNPLIRAIVPGTSQAGEELLLEATRRHDEILDCLQYQDIQDRDALEKHILNVLTIIVGTLERRESGETAGQYKKWLLQIAKDVAEAGKEGDVLGIGGTQFSEKEREFYSALEKILQ